MQLDFQARELTVKLVYYGPALSGKTTNLQALHSLVSGDARGRLMQLETRDDRTLFFDMLPISFQSERGLQVRIKLFTVPGQVIHAATRRLVLQGADGVAFIADSQKNETRANAEAFLDLRQNLADNGMDIGKIPLVIQFNKRDLPEVRTDDEIDAQARKGREPVFKAIATRGVGVLETFLGLVRSSWSQLERDHKLNEKFAIEPEALLRELDRSLNVGDRRPSNVGLAAPVDAPAAVGAPTASREVTPAPAPPPKVQKPGRYGPGMGEDE